MYRYTDINIDNRVIITIDIMTYIFHLPSEAQESNNNGENLITSGKFSVGYVLRNGFNNLLFLCCTVLGSFVL